MKTSKVYSGFTLIELLVVVGIIAVLIALLLPALRAANVAAKGAKCLSNLRGIAIAEQMYANNYDGSVCETLLPGAGSGAAAPALFSVPPAGNTDYFIKATSCPAWYDYVDSGGNNVAGATTGGVGYGFNSFMPINTKFNAIHDSAEVAMWADTVQTDANGLYLSGGQGLADPFWALTYAPTANKPLMPNFHGRHGTAGSILWSDGHATKVVPTNVPGDIVISSKTFWCHKSATYYNQRHIGYLARSQADLYSAAGEYYFQSHKELIPANNVQLFVEQNPMAGAGSWQIRASLWQ